MIHSIGQSLEFRVGAIQEATLTGAEVPSTPVSVNTAVSTKAEAAPTLYSTQPTKMDCRDSLLNIFWGVISKI